MRTNLMEMISGCDYLILHLLILWLMHNCSFNVFSHGCVLVHHTRIYIPLIDFSLIRFSIVRLLIGCCGACFVHLCANQ